jgi:hypothetical protein
MFSLRSLAAHNLPENIALPEIVAQDILTHTKNKIREIGKKIAKEDSKYHTMYKNYTNILDPEDDFTGAYAQKYDEECLYDIMSRLYIIFKDLYTGLPKDYEEGTEWYAYFEYMFFRAFPDSSIVWDFSSNCARIDNKRLIVVLWGLYDIITEVPIPCEQIPPELTEMHRIFFVYADHVKNLHGIIKDRFSYSNVFKLQKKYVYVYKERSRVKEILKKSREFYDKIKYNMYSSVFVPIVLRC